MQRLERETAQILQTGTADLRVIEAMVESMKTGHRVRVQPGASPQHPDEDQKIDLPAVKVPKIVNAESPSMH